MRRCSAVEMSCLSKIYQKADVLYSVQDSFELLPESAPVILPIHRNKSVLGNSTSKHALVSPTTSYGNSKPLSQAI